MLFVNGENPAVVVGEDSVVSVDGTKWIVLGVTSGSRAAKSALRPSNDPPRLGGHGEPDCPSIESRARRAGG